MVRFNLGLGLKPCLVTRRKGIFLEYLFPFDWAAVADTIGFKDLRFLFIFGLSHVSVKLCKKDFRERLYVPFSGFSVLTLFRKF